MRGPSNSSSGPSSSSNPLFQSTSSTIPLTPSAFLRLTRLGSSYPLFKGSKIRVQGIYDLALIGINRSRSFGGTTSPYFIGSRFTAIQVHVLISYIQSLLRANAYDESCIERLIADTVKSYLQLLTKKFHVFREYRFNNHEFSNHLAVAIVRN